MHDGQPVRSWTARTCQPGAVEDVGSRDEVAGPGRAGRRDEVAGAQATSRRTRTLVGLALVLLVLGVGADRWLVERERTALLATVEEAETAVTASQNSLLSLMEYAGRLLTDADVPAATRTSALATLSRDAARWQPRVRARHDGALSQRIAPWHGDLRAARDAYALRLDVWADRLAEVERRPQALSGGGAEVRRSRQRAVDRLLDAGADAARVRSLLGSGEAESRARR